MVSSVVNGRGPWSARTASTRSDRSHHSATKSVRRQSPLKRTGEAAVLVDVVAPGYSPQLHNVQIGVFDLQRIERPFDQFNSLLQRVIALREFERASEARDCDSLPSPPACGNAGIRARCDFLGSIARSR